MNDILNIDWSLAFELFKIGLLSWIFWSSCVALYFLIKGVRLFVKNWRHEYRSSKANHVPLFALFLAAAMALQIGCTTTEVAENAGDRISSSGGALPMAERAGFVPSGTTDKARKVFDVLAGKSLINPIQAEAGWRFETEIKYIGTDALTTGAPVKPEMFRGYARFSVEYDPFVGVPFTSKIDLSKYNSTVKAAASVPVKPAADAAWTDSGAVAAALEAIFDESQAGEEVKP